MNIFISYIHDSHIDDIIHVFKKDKDAIEHCKRTIKDVKRKTSTITETEDWYLSEDVLYSAETNDEDTYGYVKKLKLE